MNELLKISANEERVTVSARDLHRFLEVTERFNNWFERMSQYGLIEEEDFTSVKNFTVVNNGAKRELQDYQLTIDAAKQISMLQRNDKGTEARKYFIQVENDWNSPEKVMARALQYSKREIDTLRIENEEMKPKALFADSVASSHTSILVGDLAKILKQNGIDIGQNRLFEELRQDGFLIRRKGASYNTPTQRSMEMDLFEIIERTHNNPDGSTKITKTTKVTGKGQIYFINRYLKERGE